MKIEEATKRVCPYSLNRNISAPSYCYTTSCMFWKNIVKYDEFGDYKRLKNEGFCGIVGKQEGE